MHGTGRRYVSCALLALCASGCASSRKGVQRVAASHLAATATSYNQAIEQTQDEMLLLNVIRAKDHHPMYITDASKVTGTVRLDLSLGLKVPVHGGTEKNASDYSATPNIDYSSSPAMDVNLLNAQDFMRGFLAPIPQDRFAYYWDQGWPSEFLLYLLVLRVDVYQRQEGCKEPSKYPLEPSKKEPAEKEEAKKAEDGKVWSLRCSVNNHPDVFDPDLTELTRFARLVDGQVFNGRPRLRIEDAKDADVGPALPPTKFDELLAVANQAGLTLSIGANDKTKTKFQLRQDKKVYTLVPVSSENYSCKKPYEANPEEYLSWYDLTEKTPDQIVMGSRCSQFVYALRLRSPEGVLYYLGQLARLEEASEQQEGGRAVLIHVCDFDQKCADEEYEPPRRPLFVALPKRRHGCSDGIIEVRSRDAGDYFIPKDEKDDKGVHVEGIDMLAFADASHVCSAGRSMMALTLASQLIGLQKTAKDVSITSTVKLVGQ
jgi:hypothetical protein